MMKTLLKFKILGLALLAISFFACDSADQETSGVISPAIKPVATFTTDFTGTTINEGDTIIVTIKTDKWLDRALTFSARINSGTLSDDDIEVTPGVISPYSDSTAVQVVFLKDWEVDDAETAVLEFGLFTVADRYLVNPTTVNKVINLTAVNNYVSDIMDITFTHALPVDVYNIVDKEITLTTGYKIIVRDTVPVAKNTNLIDFDFYIADAAGFDINNPGPNTYADYGAATGAYPEVFHMEGYPDGEYIIYAEIYANDLNKVTAPTAFLSYKDSTQNITVATNFVRQGTAMKVDFTQDPATLLPVYSEAGDVVICKVTVAAGKYTVENYDATTSGPWKASAIKSSRPSFVKKMK